jgi:hypothetical protein
MNGIVFHCGDNYRVIVLLSLSLHFTEEGLLASGVEWKGKGAKGLDKRIGLLVELPRMQGR